MSKTLAEMIEWKIGDLQRAKEDCPAKWMCRKDLIRIDGKIEALTVVKEYLDDEANGVKFSSASAWFGLGTVWR